jgi:putative phage-type endonuclease
MKLVGRADHPQEWHDERMLGIGGSEAAAAVGLSPWQDPLDLWAIKRGEAPPPDQTLRMRIGSLVEPAIGKLYEEQTGRKLRAHHVQYVHPEYLFVRDHPDFSVVGERKLVQAKHPDVWSRDEWGEPGKPESIPVHYRIQGYHEMLATGFDRVDFAVLFGSEFGIWPLERDDELLADLLHDETEFWRCVVTGDVPKITKASGPALGRRFPKPDGEVKIASAEQEAPIREYLAAREALALAQDRVDPFENLVKLMIGEAQAIEGAGARISWGIVKGSVSWKAVASFVAGSAVDEIAEKFRGEPYRKISIAKLGRSERKGD